MVFEEWDMLEITEIQESTVRSWMTWTTLNALSILPYPACNCFMSVCQYVTSGLFIGIALVISVNMKQI